MTAKRLWATGVAWLLLSISLWASDADPAVLVLAGIIAAISAVGFTTYDLLSTTVTVKWSERRTPPAPDARVAKLHKHLDVTATSGPTELHATLVTLVDDRLAAHHRIDRTVAPDDAAAVLSPRLQRLTAGAQQGNAALGELQRIVSDIEEL